MKLLLERSWHLKHLPLAVPLSRARQNGGYFYFGSFLPKGVFHCAAENIACWTPEQKIYMYLAIQKTHKHQNKTNSRLYCQEQFAKDSHGVSIPNLHQIRDQPVISLHLHQLVVVPYVPCPKQEIKLCRPSADVIKQRSTRSIPNAVSRSSPNPIFNFNVLGLVRLSAAEPPRA